jgi:hypothetical protein
MLLLPSPTKPSSFERADSSITFTLVRPSYALAQEILAAYSQALVELSALNPDSDPAQTSAAAMAYVKAIPPDLVTRLFAENVRDVQGFGDEAGNPVTISGADLLALVPDENLVMHVIAELRVMCVLGKGKPTRSSSGSTSEHVGDRSPSTAQPTDACAATAPTDATASSAITPSSSE